VYETREEAYEAKLAHQRAWYAAHKGRWKEWQGQRPPEKRKAEQARYFATEKGKAARARAKSIEKAKRAIRRLDAAASLRLEKDEERAAHFA
jgi:hypothetical protein